MSTLPLDTVLHGDALELLRTLPAASVDAMIVDPPSATSFMGMNWDGDRGGRDAWIAWLEGIMAEALRVLVPGAHVLVWAFPRTSHWTGIALENAGFEIRGSLYHLFGQGMPKGKNTLKPAVEPWWLARKPGRALRLSIDACRIPWADEEDEREAKAKNQHGRFGSGPRKNHIYGQDTADRCNYDAPGRWPPNVVITHSIWCREGACVRDCPVAELERQHKGASRYFPQFRYQPKPDRAERDAGCEHLPTRRSLYRPNDPKTNSMQMRMHGSVDRKNHHPAVKSIALLRWMSRLICPPRGVVLDCFAGSGSTALACIAEGMHYVLIEREADYIQIAQARIHYAIRQGAATSKPTSRRRTSKHRPAAAVPIALWEKVEVTA